MTPIRRAAGLVAAVAAVGALGACGSDGDAADDPTGGLAVARRSGCTACHSVTSSGGDMGPSWVGLYHSTVALRDGSTVVADAAYLTESIKDPAAKLTAGFTIAMPENRLSDAEVAKIVAYIESLAAD